jgi:hypothetical protein
MFNKEPTVFFNVLGEVARAVIPVLLIFNVVSWSQEQTGTLTVFINVLITAAVTMFSRSQTVSTTVADKQIEIAKASSVSTPNEQIIKEAKESV